MNTDPAIVDRAYRLFTFLSRVEQLKSSPVRSVHAYDRDDGAVLWVHQMPVHEAVQVAVRDFESSDGLTVLSVERLSKHAAPRPPADIEPWIAGTFDRAGQEPQLRPSRTIMDRGEEITLQLQDEFEVLNAFEGWLAIWRRWSEREIRERPVRDLYERLFRIHATIGGRSEDLELLLGVGLLSWHPDDHPALTRHIASTPLVTRIDDRTGSIELRVDDSAIGLRTELDMIDPGSLPPRDKVEAIQQDAHDFAEHPLDSEAFEPLGAKLINHLDPEGRYVGGFQEVDPQARALISFTPAVILRKRSRLGMMHLLETVARQIKEPPQFLPA